MTTATYNPYDLALENYSLRVARDYGHPLTYREGVDDEGAAWCKSFFRGQPIDKAVVAPLRLDWKDEARRMIMSQPIQRACYAQLASLKLK